MIPTMTTFFEPTPEFLTWFTNYANRPFVIECGAGQCEFAKKLISNGIRLLAVEPYPSDELARECYNFLYPTTIHECGIIKSTPALVFAARPNHSGWFQDLIDMVHPDSELLYIGLEKNLVIDVEHGDPVQIYTGAGQDGENVWSIKR